MTPLLRAAQDGAVLRLTLSDNATRNSLSEGMLTELALALKRADADQSVRAIVIAADGQAFCSGHNLKELTSHRKDPDQGAAYFKLIFETCAKLMLSISQHRCPVIAEVDGMASAAGCQLVATCDLAFASPRAGFCTPGVNIGLFCSTPMVPLSRAVSSKKTMEMLLLGDVQNAEFALRAGLINAVVPQNELTAHVSTIARRIAEKSGVAIRYGKRAFYEQRSLPLEEAYGLTARIMTENMLEGAACEGIEAFINKRSPNWPPPHES